jgi:hypothetical protein
MKKFKHVNLESVEEVAAILKENGSRAKVIAGGTDLLGEMQDSICPNYPELLVNIKTIPGLDYIKSEGRTLKIGALTRLEDIARNNTILRDYSLLAEAAGKTASPHIREMGSIGGNICQNNRCWYYWVPDNRFNCMRKGGRVCYALTGDARYHSIFGSTKTGSTPCSAACPAHIDIPLYMSKIRENSIDEAAKILLRSNPIPAVTGRVCPHFCQLDCNRNHYDSTVSIRSVERYIGDYILDNASSFIKSPAYENGKRVCIVGSGPAGISAAFYLRQLGYDVVIYERLKKAGGMLMHGIPPYRLPRGIVEREISALQTAGIQFITGQGSRHRCKSEQPDTRIRCYILRCGAWKERESGIEGDDLLSAPALNF